MCSLAAPVVVHNIHYMKNSVVIIDTGFTTSFVKESNLGWKCVIVEDSSLESVETSNPMASRVLDGPHRLALVVFVNISPTFHGVWSALKLLISHEIVTKVRSEAKVHQAYIVAEELSTWLTEELEVYRSKQKPRGQMEFWNPPQLPLTYDPSGSPVRMRKDIQELLKAELLTINDVQKGKELPPTILTPQKEKINDVPMDGEVSEKKLPDVEVDNLADNVTCHTGHTGKYTSFWLFLAVFLLQFSFLKAENCTVFTNHIGQYVEVFNFVLNINLSSYNTIECPHGCCGQWGDVCCGEPQLETPKEEPANETLDQADTPDVDANNERSADISYDQDFFNLIAVGILLCFAVIFGKKKKSKRGKPL